MDGSPQAQGRPPLPSILLICLLLYLTTRSDVDPFAQNALYDSLNAAKNEYGNYSAWLNGTASNYTEELPPKSLIPLAETILPPHPPLDASKFSYWGNLTGFWNSEVRVHNLTNATAVPASWGPLVTPFLSDVNRTEILERIGGWHWSEVQKASFRVSDTQAPGEDGIQTIAGHLDMEGTEGFSRFQFSGLHFPMAGTIYGLMSPNGYEPDIRRLPPMVPAQWRNASSYVIKSKLKERVEAFQRQIDTLASDSETESRNADTTCNFYFFVNVVPSPISVASMTELEAEMKHPTGISTASRPLTLADALLVSHNCAIAVEIKGATGLKVDHFWRKVTTYAGLASLLYLGLLGLLVQQMEATRTPAGIASVSRWGFVFQATMDAFSFTSHAMFGVLTKNKASLSMIAPGFLACILALMFEVRFTSLIHRIQAPEDAATLNPRPAPAAAAATQVVNGIPGVRPTTPPPPPRFANLRRVFNAATNPDTRFWVFLFFLFIITLQVTLSTGLLLFTVVVLHSFWLPQIVRNVLRGCRKAMRKRYVIGTTCLRALLPLYAFACPNNILLIEPNPVVYGLLAWLGLQVMVLVGQEYLGASFFIPKGWVTTPDVYDYHPNLISDPEAPEQNLGDCAICMEPIVIKPEGEKGDGSHLGPGASLLNAGMRRHYAFTPCSHIMHTACLEQWMRVKNICPSCRTPLPPL